MAACEAALGSNVPGKGYGQSELALEGLNLFGMKQHTHPLYGDLMLPTREFIKGNWTEMTADFVKYPDLKSCFLDRMNTLKAMAAIRQPSYVGGALIYPEYAAALASSTPIGYIIAVSKRWSTDPNRAGIVSEIYSEYNTFMPPLANNSE